MGLWVDLSVSCGGMGGFAERRVGRCVDGVVFGAWFLVVGA